MALSQSKDRLSSVEEEKRGSFRNRHDQLFRAVHRLEPSGQFTVRHCLIQYFHGGCLCGYVTVGAGIARAVIQTLIANKFFLPAHLLEEPVLDDRAPDEKDIQNKF